MTARIEKKTTLIAFALTFVAGAATALPIGVPARDLGSALGDVGHRVFRSQAEWRTAVATHRWRGGPETVFPPVNWDREMVVAVSMGKQPTTGYGIEITDVTRNDNEMVVHAVETRPEPGSIQGQMVTYPSDAVAISRSSLPVRFVITQRTGRVTAQTEARNRSEASGLGKGPSAETIHRDVTIRRGYGAPYVPGSRGVASSVVVYREVGGIGNLSRQTILHLYGRPVSLNDVGVRVRQSRDVQVTGPAMRRLEVAARDNSFMGLRRVYGVPGAVPDQMARTLRVEMGGKVKEVTVYDGGPVPPAFEAVWKAAHDAAASKGSTAK